MENDHSPRAIEIYRPGETLPAEQSGRDPRLPQPMPQLPPDFPLTGIFQLLRLRQAARLSSRYTAALDTLAGLYHAAAGVHEAKLDFKRSIARLHDADTVLAMDKDNRAEERIRAEARKTLAELELYRAKAALNEFQSRGAGGGTTANSVANEISTILKSIAGDNTAP